jgi:vacuolar-type H+-ATPase subunit F/Vma7
MDSLAAVGNRVFTVALVGAGAEPFPCETTQEFEQALRRLALRKDVQLVFVPESEAAASPEAMESFRRRSTAALLALPLAASDRHASMDEVRRLIEQATGASLI